MKQLTILRAALADARRRNSMEEYSIILAGINRLWAMFTLADMPTAKVVAA